MTWRAVPGYEGHYEAHPRGMVRSVDRIIPHPCGPKSLRGRVLRTTLVGPKRAQYLAVRLSVGGVVKSERVSVVIAKTFIGPVPAGKIVCHENGDRFDNRDDNLYYGTHKENSADMVRHGRAGRAKRK